MRNNKSSLPGLIGDTHSELNDAVHVHCIGSSKRRNRSRERDRSRDRLVYW